MLQAARLLVCHSWFLLFLCFAMFFPRGCSLEGVARHLLVTACSQVSFRSLITDVRQASAGVAAYPCLSCE